MSLYYGSVGIKKIRHTLVAALTADFSAIIISSLVVNILWC